jgi:Arc/MetJ family transcription regulator
MWTNIDIDEALVSEAMRRTGLSTKRAVVDRALRLLLELARHDDIRELRGQIHWEGNLDEMRQSRSLEAVEPA